MKHSANYLRILGNAEEELCFLVEMAINNLRLNLDNTKKMRKDIGETYAREIKKDCERYLNSTLTCNE